MNSHTNARLTFARRFEMVLDTIEGDRSVVESASRHGVTPPTARRWCGVVQVGGLGAA
jgi:transposase-like protein